MAKQTKRFKQWMEWYGWGNEIFIFMWMGTRETSAIERIAWRAYQRGRMDERKKHG